MSISDSARQWMHALARLRGQLVRMRASSHPDAAGALDLAEQSLHLVDTLRSECAALEKRCAMFEAQVLVNLRDTNALLDLLPLALVVTDNSGAIVDANRAAAILLGRSTPRLKQELLLHFFDDRAAFSDILRSIASTATPMRTSMKVRPRERAPFVAHITLARDPRQGELRWLWFLDRVSAPQMPERKHAPPASERSRIHPDES